jgi:hypothetical protein
LNFIFGIVCLFVCVCAFSLRRESPDMILGDKPLIFEVVLSHYLTARLEKTALSEKMIKEDLSWVKESATKSTYRLGVGFERCEKKGEKSAPKFVPSSSYHKEEEALKSTKAHYPSNTKPSFNPNREVRKETPKPREEAFICMFCGRAGHLDEFCFRRKRIERRRVEYARDSYRDEFIDFFVSFLFSCSASLLLLCFALHFFTCFASHFILCFTSVRSWT